MIGTPVIGKVAPVEYNGGYLDMSKSNSLKINKDGFIDLSPSGVRYTIVTDYFHCLLKADENFLKLLGDREYSDEEITLRKLNLCAPMFLYGYEVIFRGKTFGKLHVQPRSKAILKNNEMKFELANNANYEIGCFADLDYMFKKMGWKILSICRLDIALDGRGFFRVMEDLFQGRIEKVGKSKCQFFTNSKIQLEGCDIGKRSSDKWVTCYNKTADIQRTNKHYITDFWTRTGLIQNSKIAVALRALNDEFKPELEDEPIERLELKLRNEAIKQIIDFDWRKLDDFEYLASIFRTFIEGGNVVDEDTGETKIGRGLIDFVEKSNDSNISRRKRIRFINWDVIGGERLDRLSTRKTNEVYRMKLTCKTMAWIFIQTKEPHYLHMCREIAENINCLDWLAEKYDSWVREFHKRKFDYLPGYKQGYAGQQLQLYEVPKQAELF